MWSSSEYEIRHTDEIQRATSEHVLEKILLQGTLAQTHLLDKASAKTVTSNLLLGFHFRAFFSGHHGGVVH